MYNSTQHSQSLDPRFGAHAVRITADGAPVHLSIKRSILPSLITGPRDPEILARCLEPEGNNPLISKTVPCFRSRRCWPSSQTRYTCLQAIPLHSGGLSPMKPAGLQHLQKAAMQKSLFRLITVIWFNISRRLKRGLKKLFSHSILY